MSDTRTLPHLAHWGAVRVTVEGEGDQARVVGVDFPAQWDPKLGIHVT